MNVLMSLQQSQLETDDPTTSYMLQVWNFFNIKFTLTFISSSIYNLCYNLKMLVYSNLAIFAGMGTALQVPGTRFSPIHGFHHASFAPVHAT